MTGEQPAIWVYAVVPAGARPPPGPGVDGATPRPVTHAGLTAIVSSVDQAADAAEWDRRLRDPAGLERIARAHHEVVSVCFRAGPTVPFRLATLYRDDAGVRDLLAGRATALAAALAAVTGRAEWGVQAYAVPAAPEPADVPAAGVGPGTAYLFRQRGRRAARERAERVAREVADRIGSALAAAAVAARPQSSTDARRPGAPGTLVLNVSYLVEERNRDGFRATVERLARRHAEVSLRMTGPWPAYSFVDTGVGEDS